MAPKTDEVLQTEITCDEEWAALLGDGATKDMLFVVEVFATWCGPSAAIQSTLKRLTMEYAEKKVKFMVANADTHPSLEKYRKTARPTFLFIVNGDQAGVLEGVNMPNLEKLLAEHIPEGLLELEHDATKDADDDDD